MEEKYLKQFDKIFGTNTLKQIKFNNKGLLKVLFDSFGEELYKPSKKYNELRIEEIHILDNLENTFSEEQKELFKKYCDIVNEMGDELQEQLFIFGYIISKKFDIEGNIKE